MQQQLPELKFGSWLIEADYSEANSAGTTQSLSIYVATKSGCGQIRKK